jgi:hypothetical protein
MTGHAVVPLEWGGTIVRLLVQMSKEGKFNMGVPRFRMLAAAIFALGIALPTAARAGGDRCWHDCYREGSAPSYERTFTRRVEIERGAYEIAREPSLYGWATRQVLVSRPGSWKDYGEESYRHERRRILIRPYKNIAIYHRARHKYVKERVTIEPEGPVWEPNGYYGSSKDW